MYDVCNCMSLFMYVCIYVFMHLCIYLCMYVCIYVFMYFMVWYGMVWMHPCMYVCIMITYAMEPQKDAHSPFDHPSYESKAPETFNSDKSLPDFFFFQTHQRCTRWCPSSESLSWFISPVFVGDISIVFMGL